MTATNEDLGLIAYQQGDFTGAFEHWHKLANEGNSQACHNIAMLYLNGQGVDENPQLGLDWCEKAAELGLAEAQHHLGYLLLHLDAQKSLVWWEKAAQQGLAEAQHDLAQQYLTGEIVPQDNDTAADWYELAAQQGHAPSQFNLGVLYANAKQFANARYWWEKAAELGFEQADDALNQLKNIGF